MRWILYIAVAAALSGYAESNLHPLKDRRPLALEMRERQVEVASSGKTASAVLSPAEGQWDCSSKLWMLVDIENKGRAPVMVRANLTAKNSESWKKVAGGVSVPGGKTATLPVLILHQEDDAALRQFFGEMRGYPGGYQYSGWRQIPASKINRVKLDFFTDGDEVDCDVSNLRAAVDFEFPNIGNLKKNYVPVTDEFGQNRHADWPEKIHSETNLIQALQRETAELQKFQPLDNRSRWGGWTGGERFAASGHFQTLERDGVWCLVDPGGYPFWSLGIDCLNLNSGTTKTPGVGKWNPRLENLQKKYGDNWRGESVDFMHRRLHVWGVNTLGNWSSADFYQVGRTPYTVAVHFWRNVIPEKGGDASKALPDVFHPDFSMHVFDAVRKFRTEANDPWCIGFFIDNELSFAQPVSPAAKALDAPEDCFTRQEFIRQLQEKYGDFAALKAAWGSDASRWADLRSTGKNSWRDLQDLSEMWYRKYFGTCRDAMRELAPHKLYLGSRINHTDNKTALSICAEFADVVSINLYDYTPDVLQVPNGFNAPVMIGEFHFGTITERGVWGCGLCAAMDIEHAADLFEVYMTAAMKNPLMVGAHWFQMFDQPLTGRGDGENYRIGFVDGTDTPYPDMVNACRRTAEQLYLLRESLNEH